jgi:beta-lactamase superfamily II metal-dependent hydrolase
MPAATQDSIRIRMYRVGLGDCFLLTLPGSRHVLFDCGVHSQGDAGTLDKAMDDLTAVTAGKIDLVVATHVHQDHISGYGKFAARFRKFQVKQVWMPWTEDPADKKAAALKRKHAAAVAALTKHFAALQGAQYDGARAALVNLAGNAAALDLLKNGFEGAEVRYLKAGDKVSAPGGIAGLSAQILGPPLDPAFLARMDPPPKQRYLALKNGKAQAANVLEPFPRGLRVKPAPGAKLSQKDLETLAAMAADSGEDLAFALEQAINNTSVVALLTYAGRQLLFAGDAQYGNWQSWFEKSDSGTLLKDVDFYKVSHHGSLNATPKGALEAMSTGKFAAMVSTQKKPWPSIPYPKLMDALERQTAGKVVRSDSLDVPKAPKGPALAKLPAGFSKGAFWYDYVIPLDGK